MLICVIPQLLIALDPIEVVLALFTELENLDEFYVTIDLVNDYLVMLLLLSFEPAYQLK